MCDLSAGFKNLPSSWDCTLNTPNLPTCQWEGIQCLNQSVISINLANQNISGTISPSIGDLTSLKSLQFSGNYISGSIPDTFCYLRQLQSVYLCDTTYNKQGCPDITYVPLCLWDAQAGFLSHSIPGSLVFPSLTTYIAIGSIPSLEAIALCQLAPASVPSFINTYCTSTTPKLPKSAVCLGNIQIIIINFSM